MATGRKRQSLSHKVGFYHGEMVALSQDAKKLVAANADRDVVIWDLATGREINRLAIGGKFNNATSKWSHSVVAAGFLGNQAAYAQVDEPAKSAKSDKTSPVILCDARTGARLHTFTGENWVGHRLVFSPTGNTIAVMETKNAIRLFDSRTLKQIHQWETGGGPYSAMRFSRDGSVLASMDHSSRDKAALRLWDTVSGKKIAELTFAQFGEFAWSACVAISARGKQIAIGPFKDRTVRVLETGSGKELKRFVSPNSYISHLAFSPDDRVLIANSGHALLVWEMQTGKARHAERGVHWRGVQALAFAPDGRTVATTDGHHTIHRIHLWDSSTGKERTSWEVPKPSTVGIYSLGFSPDGRYLASCEWDKTRLWEVKTGKCLQDWERNTGFDPAAVFSPDGKVIAVVESKQEVVIRTLDSGKEERRFATGKQSIGNLAFSPDSRMIAVAVTATGAENGNHLLLCDRVTGKVETLLKDLANAFNRLSFSPDGRHLWALVPEVGLMVFDVVTQQNRELPLAMRRNNLAASFAPTGRLVAVATAGDRGQERVLSVRELASNGERFRMPLAMGCARRIAFSHDGRYLATAHPDTTVLIWNLNALPSPVPMPKRLTDKELAQLWDDLAGVDAELGYRAIRVFSANPGQTLPFLQNRLKPTPALVPQMVTKLIANLDSDQFPIRERAAKQLAPWDDAILADVKKALDRTSTLESRRRLERLLNELTDPGVNGGTPADAPRDRNIGTNCQSRRSTLLQSIATGRRGNATNGGSQVH